MVSLIKGTASSVAVAFYFLTALSPLAPLWWLTRSVGRPQTVGGIGMDGLGVWTEFMVNFKVSFFGR